MLGPNIPNLKPNFSYESEKMEMEISRAKKLPWLQNRDLQSQERQVLDVKKPNKPPINVHGNHE